MAAKKKKSGSSGKVKGRRETAQPKEQAESKPQPPKQDDKPKMPERIQEKGAGFGAIKMAAGIIIALVIGSGIAAQLGGSKDKERGDGVQGDKCNATLDCSKGFVCYSHKEAPKRCMKSCSGDDTVCEPGFTCTTGAQGGRKKAKIRSVCVEDAEF